MKAREGLEEVAVGDKVWMVVLDMVTEGTIVQAEASGDGQGRLEGGCIDCQGVGEGRFPVAEKFLPGSQHLLRRVAPIWPQGFEPSLTVAFQPVPDGGGIYTDNMRNTLGAIPLEIQFDGFLPIRPEAFDVCACFLGRGGHIV